MLKLTHKVETGSATGTLTLPLESRNKSRLKVTLDDGSQAGLFLPRGIVLHDGDLIASDHGHLIEIKAAPETVSSVRCDDPLMLAVACYHLGNRHVLLQISLDVPRAKQWQPILASCQATAFATAAAGWNISYRDAAYGYVWSWLENLMLAAVKIIPLGQTRGQQLLYTMAENIPDVVANSLEIEDEMIGTSNPALAIISSRHETQYTRLFRS